MCKCFENVEASGKCKRVCTGIHVLAAIDFYNQMEHYKSVIAEGRRSGKTHIIKYMKETKAGRIMPYGRLIDARPYTYYTAKMPCRIKIVREA